VHSPIGKQPAVYGIKLKKLPKITFATNDVDFVDPTNCDHDAFADGLRKAVYNFMHGVGLDADPRSWFARRKKISKASVPPDLVRRALAGR